MGQRNKIWAATICLLLVTACSIETEEAPAHEQVADSMEEADTNAATEEPTPTIEELRERAETDPEGADAAAVDGMSRNELVATAINSAGFLCARITDLYPSGGDIEADCVEYRNGSGRARYRIDTSTMSVEQIN